MSIQLSEAVNHSYDCEQDSDVIDDDDEDDDDDCVKGSDTALSCVYRN